MEDPVRAAEGGTGKMKLRNRFVKGLLSAMMLTALLSQPVFAADTEPSDTDPYKFTVTLSAGNQGTFDGTDTVEVTDVDPGTISVNFSAYQDQLQISDEKYYAKGIRLSGRDNSDASYSPTWTSGEVTEDTDYVVAYGMEGDMVAYTVQYLDEDGNELAPANTYYGSVGDKPVVAFQYIEGYLPQAYNLTKTLSANEADNIFPFVYAPSSETQTIVTTVTENDTVVTTTGGTGTTAGGDNAPGDTPAGGTAEENEPAGDGGDDAEADDTAETDEDAGPQETIDLDEDEVPLGNMESDDSVRETSVMPIVLGILAAVIAVAIIVGGIIYYKKHTR